MVRSFIIGRRLLALPLILLFIASTIFLFRSESGDAVVTYVKDTVDSVRDKLPSSDQPGPKYKPEPLYRPPPVKDPFPFMLTTSTPPPIPEWNRARKDLHKEYDLPKPPPLLIGFTRTWPILLQAVVSYITAGWPADQIYVIENTGVQQANARGQLTLQNPFYLNHTTLKNLGVNVVTTPTLLSFAQMQNFFLSLSYLHDWPYYFWSHMDVLVLSYEDGNEHTPRFNRKGYKSVYELGCRALADARKKDPRWGFRFFSYDHLALVNPAAFEDVGSWDTLIPYYQTDCDMHSRLLMANWTLEDARAAIVTDVNVALDDLRVLYRVPGVDATFTDPNPAPPPPPEKTKTKARRAITSADEKVNGLRALARDVGVKRDEPAAGGGDDEAALAPWRALADVALNMFHVKNGSPRGRNTWHMGQRGGQGEPYHYNAAGLQEGIEVITDAGKEVFARKWGHRHCDLITGAHLQLTDQWRVKKDWR